MGWRRTCCVFTLGSLLFLTTPASTAATEWAFKSEFWPALIRAVPGITQHLTLLSEDGAGMVIAIRDGGEPSPETRAKIAEIWERFEGLFDAEPQREQFEVFRDVTIG